MILTNRKSIYTYSVGVSYVRTRQTVHHVHSLDDDGDVFVNGIFVRMEKNNGKDIHEACN